MLGWNFRPTREEWIKKKDTARKQRAKPGGEPTRAEAEAFVKDF